MATTHPYDLLPADARSALAVCDNWLANEDGVTMRCAILGLGSTFVPYTAFEPLHPTLPTALKALAQHYAIRNVDEDGIPLHMLELQIFHTLSPQRLLVHDRRGYDYWLYCVHSARLREDELLVSASCYQTKATADGVNYVFTSFDDAVLLDFSWLDAHYPGWKNRWLVQNELGCDIEACVQNIFFPASPVPSASLSGMTFT